MLMDIATEELSHLEIVGATITMLLDGVNGELKNAAESSMIANLFSGNMGKEQMIHQAMVNPQFLALSGGAPRLTDSQGKPWSGNYVNANGDLTVDLRSDLAAESRAKIVYEYLMQFTDDPYVKETLGFLMTREIAHFKDVRGGARHRSTQLPTRSNAGRPALHPYLHEYVQRDKCTWALESGSRFLGRGREMGVC